MWRRGRGRGQINVSVHIVIVRSQAIPIPPAVILDAFLCMVLDDDHIPRRVHPVDVAAVNCIRVEEEATALGPSHLDEVLLTIRTCDPIVLEPSRRMVLHAKPCVVVRAACDQRWVVMITDRIRVDEELEPPPAAIVVPQSRLVLLWREAWTQMHNFIAGKLGRLTAKIVAGRLKDLHILQDGAKMIELVANGLHALVVFPDASVSECCDGLFLQPIDVEARI